MHANRARLAALATLSGGFLLQTGCSIADAVLSTIALAFEIVNVWA